MADTLTLIGCPIPATWMVIHFCGTLGMVRTLASLPARLGYLPWMMSLWLLLATIRTIFPITNCRRDADTGAAGVGATMAAAGGWTQSQQRFRWQTLETTDRRQVS